MPVNRTFVSPALLLAATLLLAGGCKSSAPTESVNPKNVPAATTPQINGEDVVTLQRKATSGGSAPEFLSATVIPGRGMNLLQITANLPGKGTTNVFFAPPLSEVQNKLSGSDPADNVARDSDRRSAGALRFRRGGQSRRGRGSGGDGSLKASPSHNSQSFI